MNRKDLQMILDFDPMQVAEENAEKRDEAYVLGLILNYLKGNLVKKEMIERGDTYHGMPLIDFRKIMINNGFKLIYEEEFEHKSDAMYKDIKYIKEWVCEMLNSYRIKTLRNYIIMDFNFLKLMKSSTTSHQVDTLPKRVIWCKRRKL